MAPGCWEILDLSHWDGRDGSWPLGKTCIYPFGTAVTAPGCAWIYPPVPSDSGTLWNKDAQREMPLPRHLAPSPTTSLPPTWNSSHSRPGSWGKNSFEQQDPKVLLFMSSLGAGFALVYVPVTPKELPAIPQSLPDPHILEPHPRWNFPSQNPPCGCNSWQGLCQQLVREDGEEIQPCLIPTSLENREKQGLNPKSNPTTSLIHGAIDVGCYKKDQGHSRC